MDTPKAEQKTLLPLAELAPRAIPQHITFIKRHYSALESCTLALILLLASSQCLILYGPHIVPPAAYCCELCTLLTNLAAALRISIPASLPTAALLFFASPYLARPERLMVTWYLVLLCYLVGSTSGALLLVWV